MILERNLSIRDLIIKSFSKNDYKFILSDFEDNTYFCDNLNKVLNKYNRNLDINFIKKIFKGKLNEKDTNAFCETFDKFFILTFNNEYLTKDYYCTKNFLDNSKKDYNILDELINIDKNIDEKILKKTIAIMFTTLHEFNHFILRLIKSIKSGKVEKYAYSTEKIEHDLIENFKNHENFKDYYEDVNFYLNNKFELEDVYNNINENLIKNYTNYSLIKFNKDYSKLSEYDKNLIADFINLKKYKIEISEMKNELKKYQFFKYLYDQNFFIGDKDSLDIKYYRLPTSEEPYNNFIKLSNSFFAPNYILDKKEKENMWSFYRFLLFKEYNFNENTFDSKVDEYLENTYINEDIKELETRDYSYIKDIIITVNTSECFADVFAYSNMPFKIQKGMRSLGYWQRNLFKYFAENYSNNII